MYVKGISTLFHTQDPGGSHSLLQTFLLRRERKVGGVPKLREGDVIRYCPNSRD